MQSNDPSAGLRPEPSASIDWQLWANLRQVALWEACLLSMNINPSKVRHSPNARIAGDGGGADAFGNEDQAIEYAKRLRLLEEHCQDARRFTKPTSGAAGAGRNVILSEFAAWAVGLGFMSMPQELVALARKPLVVQVSKEERLLRKSRLDTVTGLSIRHHGHPQQPVMQPPDWDLWAAIPKAQLWQAVALSLNIDPGTPSSDNMFTELTSDAAQVRAVFGAEFERRLLIAVNNLAAEGPLVPVMQDDELLDDACACVRLVDFAEFARSLPKPWSLPEQFPRLPSGVSRAAGEQAPAPAAAPSRAAQAWTPESLQEMKDYRQAHSAKATAKKYGISEARVRQLLPREKAAPEGYSAFNQPLKKP